MQNSLPPNDPSGQPENLDLMYAEMYGHAESNPQLTEDVRRLAGHGFAVVPLAIWAKYRGREAVELFLKEYYVENPATESWRGECGTLYMRFLRCRPVLFEYPLDKFPLSGGVDLKAYFEYLGEGGPSSSDPESEPAQVPCGHAWNQQCDCVRG